MIKLFKYILQDFLPLWHNYSVRHCDTLLWLKIQPNKRLFGGSTPSIDTQRPQKLIHVIKDLSRFWSLQYIQGNYKYIYPDQLAKFNLINVHVPKSGLKCHFLQKDYISHAIKIRNPRIRARNKPARYYVIITVRRVIRKSFRLC